MFTPDVPSETLQNNMFAKTVVALLTGRDAQRLLDIQRACHMEQMRALTSAQAGGGLLHVLLYDPWLNATLADAAIPADQHAPPGAILVHSSETHAAGEVIARLIVAAPGNAAIAMPGIGSLPAAGSYYASPALQLLVASLPPDQLGDRLGMLPGTIGNEAATIGTIRRNTALVSTRFE